ncbi:TrkH family potassium uptake protein [Subtercola frigoramans]|uniref:Trk-type K+ transport system membrane component n=1 Tax=Subtercola frigoramans TaxID=120298 RepID=A0ABS2L1K3_9MICO|nr:potassium transporter TrkG [Subtercola frigoramans]MBM7470966.1 Trk-type K+ transport system membrane component [Subtercola frigoramans]
MTGSTATKRPRYGASSTRSRFREAVNDFSGRSPARFAVLIFLALVALFTVLLSLPVASAKGTATGFADALFTAVSAICVTGLSTVDMATHWSGFGLTVIYLGVQIGAVGVLTLASILGLVISRRLGLRSRLLAIGEADPSHAHSGISGSSQAVRLGEVGGLLATVAVSALVIEAGLTVLLFPRMLLSGIQPDKAALQSIYYSAMAFTNTGFSPDPRGLAPFATDYWFLGVLMLGVFLGSIGFPVIYAVTRAIRTPGKPRWSLHVRLTVVTSLVLLGGGAVLYFALEFSNPATFGNLNVGDKAFQSLFLSTMTRSGGFATIPIDQLNGSSMLITDMLMFIGGGSASTAGGIKVSTIAVLFLAAFAEARGNDSVEAFGRRIPVDILRLAVSVVLWGATTVAVATIVILQISGATLDAVLFDVISAFGTSGLSTGLTASLPDAGIYVMAATMFMGRIGTVTFAAALASRHRRQLYTYPEERPIVG